MVHTSEAKLDSFSVGTPAAPLASWRHFLFIYLFISIFSVAVYSAFHLSRFTILFTDQLIYDVFGMFGHQDDASA